MPTFGDLLRHERESRGRTIEDIASTSGIQQGFLEALERNDFDVLPGRAFGKLYLRAYAEILDFDPRPLIDAYDKEQKAAPAAPPLDAPRDKPRPVAEAIAKWRSAKINEG
ncbi:MAG TPA: helix-turn-helix domain-containing protein, partial [Candidatus Polarisedimenticolaceae bacterium]|nr:helix-turn-helix domain-containing protein [Candidatus Polarisedimenticolaceae bacterium]